VYSIRLVLVAFFLHRGLDFSQSAVLFAAWRPADDPGPEHSPSPPVQRSAEYPLDSLSKSDRARNVQGHFPDVPTAVPYHGFCEDNSWLCSHTRRLLSGAAWGTARGVRRPKANSTQVSRAERRPVERKMAELTGTHFGQTPSFDPRTCPADEVPARLSMPGGQIRRAGQGQALILSREPREFRES
jgi:hypothetical protein